MSSSITLYDDAGNPVVVSGEALKKGLATAWVNFDGTQTPPIIYDSYNVSNVERISTGTFAVHFAVPMDNTNYTQTMTQRAGYEKNSGIGLKSDNSINSCLVETWSSTAVADNDDNVSVTVFGGKS